MSSESDLGAALQRLAIIFMLAFMLVRLHDLQSEETTTNRIQCLLHADVPNFHEFCVQKGYDK